MAGITAYGAYIPLHRLNRAEIARAWGAGEVSGEKAVANYDEDSLTMAVAAARDCLNGIDPESVEGLYFASTTAPYKEKQSAATIATVLGLSQKAFTMDFSGSLRSGTNAVKAATDAVSSGSARSVLVCASDVRLGHPMSNHEMASGDGAAALLIGNTETIAEIEDSHAIYNELQDVWRSDRDFFIRSGEDRFIMEGYSEVVTEAVTAALKSFKLTPQDFARAAIYSPNTRQLVVVARRLGFDAKTQIDDTLHSTVGDTGTAMALMCLVSALEEAKGGDRLLLAGYGNGCDVFSLRVTDEIARIGDRRGIKKHLASKRMLSSYNKYLRWRELIDTQPPPRPPLELRQPSPVAQWRENQGELRLHGTKCQHCGTPQYPPQRVCINCQTKDEMEPYSFTDRKARLFSFCHDYVTATVEPPVTVTVVDFDGGGRIICDMTDRDPEEIKVGMPLEMTFRRLYYVGGIYNYWWKCQPVRCQG
jgi:hydroxymethylglutaryl-CoA synthase